ncbi:MAG TPA: signal peptidase II [Clostridiaceae bacterium]
MKNRKYKIWISVVLLITIEQIIKIIINNNFLHKRFAILAPFLYFEPMFNRYYSWVTSMLQIDLSKWIYIGIVAIMLVLICLFYNYLNKELGTNRNIHAMFAFICSGATCSLIDKIFWNGSLDYILVNGFFTFDLKDVYINIFIGLLILSLLVKDSVLKQIDDKNLVKDFTKYVLRKS